MPCDQADAQAIEDVRLLIADYGEEQLFTDQQISALVRLSRGSVKRGAARALLTIATSEVLLSKKIRTQDLSTDGPAVAAELRAQAKQLATEAAEEEFADEAGDVAAFYIPASDPGWGRLEGEELRGM